jgi:hypothetical protein
VAEGAFLNWPKGVFLVCFIHAGIQFSKNKIYLYLTSFTNYTIMRKIPFAFIVLALAAWLINLVIQDKRAHAGCLRPMQNSTPQTACMRDCWHGRIPLLTLAASQAKIDAIKAHARTKSKELGSTK